MTISKNCDEDIKLTVNKEFLEISEITTFYNDKDDIVEKKLSWKIKLGLKNYEYVWSNKDIITNDYLYDGNWYELKTGKQVDINILNDSNINNNSSAFTPLNAILEVFGNLLSKSPPSSTKSSLFSSLPPSTIYINVPKQTTNVTINTKKTIIFFDPSFSACNKISPSLQ